jgi:TonB-dependent starch-binding outer membrane protein SusC
MRVQFVVAGAVLCVACSSNPVPQRPVDSDSYHGIHEGNTPGSAGGSVTREDIERMHFTRIEDYIAAQVPGVQVSRRGGRIMLQMRGPSTILGNNEPLIVLDGVPLAQGTGGFALESISPQDVEKIEVLKDAGSAAIYGSRGSNGVIIIRTRRRD